MARGTNNSENSNHGLSHFAIPAKVAVHPLTQQCVPVSFLRLAGRLTLTALFFLLTLFLLPSSLLFLFLSLLLLFGGLGPRPILPLLLFIFLYNVHLFPSLPLFFYSSLLILNA